MGIINVTDNTRVTPIMAICPYCDDFITTGQSKLFGGVLLHDDCFKKLGVELANNDPKLCNATKTKNKVK